MTTLTQRPQRLNEHPLGAAADLEQAIAANVHGEVRFDAGSRALYATDASNYRQVPIGVVIPKDAADIEATIAAARRFNAPVLARGGGTSLAGQCCNVAVLMDMSKYYNRLLELDPERRIARVQPGIVLDRLRDAAEEHGLTFGPDPATHAHCTLGGMMGNNSCGVHALMAGKTVDNVEALEVMTYDGLRLSLGPLSEDEVRAKANMGGREGEIYHKLLDLRDRYGDLIRSKFPDIPRRVSGYNLPDLLPERGFNAAKALIGSEGTCVTILEATLKLVHSPRHRVLAVMGFSDINDAAAAVPDVLPYKPTGLEAIDSRLIDFLRRKHMHLDNLQLFPEGHAWLLIEFGADSAEDAMAAAHRLDSFAKDDRRGLSILEKPEEQARLWQVREFGLGVTAFVPGMRDGGPGWEDAAVDPSRLKDYLPEFRNLLNEYGYDCSLYGHFGQGCVHCRIDFDLITPSGIDHYRHFVEDAADLVVRYGGSLSGEHGDGQARAELLPRMFGNEIVQAFREFKAIWDPEGRMNPGKIVDAYRNDQNLRLGAGYEPAKVQTHFSYDHEGGSFDLATLHCVGVGNCRNEEGGTMCPSYRVTHEEKHSTRGRARLLFEMLHGDPLTKLWKEEAVKDALDLCLACKGCKSECPVNVDMATYKAEFLSHYYEKRLRPRSAYAFGLIFRWARLAQTAPWLVNLMTQTPGLGRLAKLAAGVAPQRQIPRFARTPFTADIPVPRVSVSKAERKVLLWPDTFNNYFFPDTAKAAYRVLDAAGFRVEVPQQSVCCGRPLYDYGMLGQAKKQLKEILDVFREDIRDGTPIVVLEPSCLAVFRDELTNFWPRDRDAQRLSAQTMTLAEALQRYAPEFEPMRLAGEVLLHGHCHQKSLVGMKQEEALLDRVGLDHTLLDDGCCGMAGSFGFEAGERYEVSMAVGERGILPAVRKARPETLIVADGFSCREQISQGTRRHALHLAEVLERAIPEPGDSTRR